MPNERMTGTQRRAQLLDVGRAVFAERGYDGAAIEEIADRAGVSKPVVYEHFGGKEGLYAVVVDREMSRLLDSMVASLSGRHPRVLLEQAAMALLQYVEEHSDGFTILIRESPVASTTGNFVSLIHDVVDKLEPIVAGMLQSRGFDPKLSPIYANALAGMVVLTGQWWLDARKPKRDVVAAHLVNLAWNGLAGLDPKPTLRTQRRSRS
ncbi:MAG TPA: TetR/AcrR family transcriptional regulator [Acidimicrobiales bacterium]|nr:TetR/AcrR family transcriptional regulator [Acidimicrobiales bacterium]